MFTSNNKIEVNVSKYGGNGVRSFCSEFCATICDLLPGFFKGYRTDEELWVSGGSGTLLMSPDGGETWLKDEPAGDVPSNLYRVKFFGGDQGFILGQRGYLLRYEGDVAV